MLGSSLRVLAACAVTAAVATAANAQGSWSKKAPMAAALNEVALAAVAIAAATAHPVSTLSDELNMTSSLRFFT